MDIFAPDKISLISESPEGNCMHHYHMRREWDSAYWAAIYNAYRNRGEKDSGIRAWEFFSNYVDNIPTTCR